MGPEESVAAVRTECGPSKRRPPSTHERVRLAVAMVRSDGSAEQLGLMYRGILSYGS